MKLTQEIVKAIVSGDINYLEKQRHLLQPNESEYLVDDYGNDALAIAALNNQLGPVIVKSFVIYQN